MEIGSTCSRAARDSMCAVLLNMMRHRGPLQGRLAGRWSPRAAPVASTPCRAPPMMKRPRSASKDVRRGSALVVSLLFITTVPPAAATQLGASPANFPAIGRGIVRSGPPRRPPSPPLLAFHHVGRPPLHRRLGPCRGLSLPRRPRRRLPPTRPCFLHRHPWT